jgi:hypothetical protein
MKLSLTIRIFVRIIKKQSHPIMQNTILIHVSITSKSCISSSKTYQYPLASLLVKRPKPIDSFRWIALAFSEHENERAVPHIETIMWSTARTKLKWTKLNCFNYCIYRCMYMQYYSFRFCGRLWNLKSAINFQIFQKKYSIN